MVSTHEEEGIYYKDISKQREYFERDFARMEGGLFVKTLIF